MKSRLPRASIEKPRPPSAALYHQPVWGGCGWQLTPAGTLTTLRVVPLSMTQQEIANRVGATREMINHILRDLIRGGFLARDEKKRLVFTRELPKRW
jgi:CRP-like cAMP-binding protein